MSKFFGFVSGVTCTSALLYSFSSEIRKNTATSRTIIAETAASVERALSKKEYTIVKPVPVKTVSITEACKDIWDEEIVKGSKYVLNGDLSAWIMSLITAK
ncbi:hypothetical protein V1512DRAFT_276675 [Lipomyces arxii]|uniref:uncharacterized protein n=1 Tax=Lipomyces arxii TaxID=56418 RepID=UPI0034CFAFD6